MFVWVISLGALALASIFFGFDSLTWTFVALAKILGVLFLGLVVSSYACILFSNYRPGIRSSR